MSSLVLLLVVCLLVLSPCVSGSASYTLYSDAACATQTATASGISVTTYTSGSNTGFQSTCFTITGAGGVVSGQITGVTSGGAGSSYFITYNAASCPAASLANTYTSSSSGTGSGTTCVAGIGSTSAKFSISGAGHSAMLSMPILLLLLAGLLVVLI